MKMILEYFYYILVRLLLSLRYRIKLKGFKELKKVKFPHQGGILFLANHPAKIDPCILLRILWLRYRPHPVAIDSLFWQPLVGYLLKFIRALSIPNFDLSANSYKKRQFDKTYEEIFGLLNRNENLLIYPSGSLKHQAKEKIGGASGVHAILQRAPETNVVLIRTRGLWGSSFSRALTGKTPDLMKTLKQGIWVVLKNGIFFTPRREVIVECAVAPPNFSKDWDRLTLNRYLENWYNSPDSEPIKLVSFSFWKEDLPQCSIEVDDEEISLIDIPEEIKQKVLQEVSRLTKRPMDKIRLSDDLSTDLGLDSLDMAELIFVIREYYGISEIHKSDLTSVGKLMTFAAGLSIKKAEKESSDHDRVKEKGRPSPFYPEGETIFEVFFKTCDRMQNYMACVDQSQGKVSYKKLKMGVLLLTEKMKKIPEKNIGIMLPASVAVNMLSIATMLAGKIPVMINWTLGRSNLRSIIEQSNTKVILSSWDFIDHLDHIDFDGIEDQIVLLEKIKYTFLEKCKAFLHAYKKPDALVKILDADRIKKEDTAVILFTSGTESKPKGVPLSHENILANQRGAYAYVDVKNEDIMLGVLPPFHSFGFSVTGLFPILTGLPVVYSPNPTESRRIVNTMANWSITIFCIAPTFLKNLLRVGTRHHFHSLRLVVTGAEKTSKEMYEELKNLNPNTMLIEGYGITECSPILTLNPPNAPIRGVGVPLPGVELLIVDPETFSLMDTGQQGLILARGANIFRGYLNPYLSSPFIKIRNKLWYQTGDLGAMDKQGYLTLSGRLKRFIKIAGEMVSLGAIEEVLIGAAKQRGWRAHSGHLFALCPVEEVGKKSEIHLFTIFDLSVDQVNHILREQGMSNLIKISSTIKVTTIPILGTGKIDYKSLRNQLENLRKQ
ncbi:MAG: AMP-binding protein [Chlamydiales bacterium]